MPNLGIAQWCMNFELEETMLEISRLGCECIHIEVGEPNSINWLGNSQVMTRLINASDKYQIRFAAIAVNALCEFGMNQTLDSPIGKLAWQATHTAIIAASKMNIPVVTLPSFDNGLINTQQDLDNTISFLNKTMMTANNLGVMIASENNLPIQQLYTLTQENKDIWILFDTFNPLLFNIDPLEIWQKFNDRIYPMVHIKDGKDGLMGNVLLGQGITPLKDFLLHFKNSRKTIDLIIETEYSYLEGNIISSLSKDIAYIRKIWNSH